MDDECCAVCAEPLEWTGYGPCGHLQTCSNCVARLRFTLKDKRCTICQQEIDVVVFTRYNGNYTLKLTPEQFAALPSRREYKYLSVINGYFDEESEYQTIRQLCSYTHPQAQGGLEEKFPNLIALKKHLKEACGLVFCDICLAGRKVFVCKQLLYTPREAKTHMSVGEQSGPLAEAGFKGHPLCQFCRSRFYSDSELFKHNTEKHETCFICRKEAPHVYRYYRNYEHLEEHFRGEHFLCENQECLKQRFVVFAREPEFKHHKRVEHERKEGVRLYRGDAPRLPTNFHYSRSTLSTRGRGRGRFQLDARQEYAASNQDELHGIPDLATSPEPRPVQLTDADFPSIIDNAPITGQGRWPVRGRSRGSVLRRDSFPSLSGNASTAAGQKTLPKGRTMASRITAKRPTQSQWPPGQPLFNPNLQPMRNVANTLPLEQEFKTATNLEWPVRKQREPQPIPKQPNRWVTLSKKPEDVPSSSPPSALLNDLQLAEGAEKFFPALTNDFELVPTHKQQQKWGRHQEKPKSNPKPQAKQNGPSLSDASAFPSLNPSSVSAAQPSNDGSTASRLKVSQGLKAANKTLLKTLKDQMDRETFNEFYGEAQLFLKDGLSSEVFHKRLVNHGLAHHISEIANNCPNTAKRSELFSIHLQFIEQCKRAPDSAPVFMPISVLERAYKRTIDSPPWACPRCLTVNLSEADFCESCDTGRHEALPRREQRPDPIPIVYRHDHRQRQQTLFGVNDRKKPSNAWTRRT